MYDLIISRTIIRAGNIFILSTGEYNLTLWMRCCVRAPFGDWIFDEKRPTAYQSMMTLDITNAADGLFGRPRAMYV